MPPEPTSLARLYDFLRRTFAPAELQLLIALCLPGGRDLRDHLPGLDAPAATWMFALVDALDKRALIQDQELWFALLRERPQLMPEIVELWHLFDTETAQHAVSSGSIPALVAARRAGALAATASEQRALIDEQSAIAPVVAVFRLQVHFNVDRSGRISTSADVAARLTTSLQRGGLDIAEVVVERLMQATIGSVVSAVVRLTTSVRDGFRLMQKMRLPSEASDGVTISEVLSTEVMGSDAPREATAASALSGEGSTPNRVDENSPVVLPSLRESGHAVLPPPVRIFLIIVLIVIVVGYVLWVSQWPVGAYPTPIPGG